MKFNPIYASEKIKEYYLRYIETAFYINDKEYFNLFREKLRNKSYFSKGPYLDATDSFKSGKSLRELIDEDVVSRYFLQLNTNSMPIDRPLYAHQEKSIRTIAAGKNAVITTGTGSGKTESFLLPILNHLFRELEKGTLGSGVRALLIYPMNALANDQMKRMRELLKNVPQITFGAYTGETPDKQKEAEEKFKKLNKCNPLPNELISREVIKENPPQILITNYAMLEYLMLRPADNSLFSGEYSDSWKFVVLDEAHTYTGASGIEVSMLLKRLKARLDKKNLQYILTSATLGSSVEDNADVIHFANTICSVDNFRDENIIRADRVKIYPPSDTVEFPREMYSEMLDVIDSTENNDRLFETIKKFYPGAVKGRNIEETVFNTLILDDKYYCLKNMLSDTTLSVYDVIDRINLSAENIVDFISLISKGRKNGVSLFDARYHYFIRTLEGAYLTLPPYKNLFIEPCKTYHNQKVFQFSVCSNCGEIYIEGYRYKDEKTKIQYFSSSIETDWQQNSKLKKEYYLLNGNKFDDEGDSYILCGCCGAIYKKYAVGKSAVHCECGRQYLHEVTKVPEKMMNISEGRTLVKKCMVCETVARNNSVLRDFYMGQAAAASVIGTSLYEQLPSKKNVICVNENVPDDDDFFGFSISNNADLNRQERIDKQYIIFSDSRQEAAYFASYFDTTYHNLLRRRILVEVLKKRKNEYKEGVSASTLCRHLEAEFSQYKIFEPDRRKEEALKTIIYEMVSGDRNGLEGIGIISFSYKYSLSPLAVFKNNETTAVVNIMADGFRRKCALKYETITPLSEDDKEYFQYSSADQTIALSKENQTYKSASCDTWISGVNKNIRSDYLTRLSMKLPGGKWDSEKIIKFLTAIWRRIFVENSSIETDNNIGYRMKIDDFLVHSCYSEDIMKYRCSHCGKITVNNADGVCPEYRCDGILEPFDISEFKDNHYYRVYNELDIYDLKVKEHTAQLDLETAKRYQEQFVNKEINVLSCSTTFEMGVDVGDLETVFMKNMPPTPANYIQRAGRAGRRTDSAAYALTFCRLSSHDLIFYRTPEKMIKGHISPPGFEISNEKIVKRHMNACCFSEFFRRYYESFSNVETFFLNGFYEKFRQFISSRDHWLMNILYTSCPEALHCCIDSWLNNLTSDEGELNQLYLQTVDNINELEQYADKLSASKKPSDNYNAGNIRYAVKAIKDMNILTYLSRKNILPKYGFPVDSIELETKRGVSQLRLSRDLSIAISEYAPDSEIVADGKIYTSRYIKTPPNRQHKWLEYYFGRCSNPECDCINISLSEIKPGTACKICKSEIENKGKFIIPEYGFIADAHTKPTSTRKPERTYRGDVHYIGDASGTSESYKLGDIEITVTRTVNDELLVMNNTAFYVCPVCGYAHKQRKGLNENEKKTDKGHKNPYGKICTGKEMQKMYLGHRLKTDVAIINISEPFEPEQALSVLYALLEGVSSYYSIERKDISGCLHTSYSSNKTHTIFVLYDTVPGGAGHMSRVAKGGKDTLIGVLKEAYRIVAECTCGGENGDGACYSCLCNYENQKNHDKLNRGKAKRYIGKILNNV